MTRARDVANRTIVANAVGATELNLTDNYAFTGTVSGAGKILQIQQHVEDGQTSFTNQTSLRASRLLLAANAADSTSHVSVTITPSSTSNKIILMGHVFYEATTGAHEYLWAFHRDTTLIGAPASGIRGRGIASSANNYQAAADNDSTPESRSFQFVDSPSSTSAITYCISYNTSSTSGTLYLNRTVTNSNSASFELGVSSIIAMEIAG